MDTKEKPAEHWHTKKVCKCGTEIVISYTIDDGKRIHEINVEKGGFFRSRTWPNYVYCTCGRRHDLTKFNLL
jgi:hypothetical protein